MDTSRLILSDKIKQEPEYEVAERTETNIPICQGNCNQEHVDDVDQAQGCSHEDSPSVQASDDKIDRANPERKKIAQIDVYGEYGEIYSCVQGYLPNSRAEYLQVMPGGRYLEFVKQDTQVDGLSEHTSSSVSREGGASVIETSGGGHTESREREKSTSEDVFRYQNMTADGKRVNSLERPFTCDICGVGFTWRSHLNRHKRIHTGEKPYRCDVCGVGFTQCEHLKDHKRTHTGEKPFKCDMCDVGFTSCTSLKHHKRIHTGEKPYKCDVCGMKFTQNSNLTMHKRTHTGEKPYRCDVCGVGFARCEHLKKHKRIHTGERPYKCDVCGAGFTVCTSLKSHMRVHTKEKPYNCDVCGVGFAQSGPLKTHKRIHTG